MKIQYKDIHDFSEKELEELFLSVDWSSGHFPEKLECLYIVFSLLSVL